MAISFAEASYLVGEAVGAAEVCVQLLLVMEPTQREILVNISAVDSPTTLGKINTNNFVAYFDSEYMHRWS